jgi:hypothetical protein
LRCFAFERKNQWAQWLPLVEWWYNTSILSCMPGVSKVQEADKNITVREGILRALKDNFVMAQNHMKQQAEQGRFERHLVEGDQVFLRIQPYKNTSLKSQHCQKIEHKFYGPYTVLKHVGSVAYQLALPSQSKLHLAFHVSCLKKVIGTVIPYRRDN